MRFVDAIARPLPAAVAAALTLSLAACGSSAPRQAAVSPPPLVAPAAEIAGEPSARERREADVASVGERQPAEAPSRNERRGSRRGAEREQEVADASAAEPVPEAAAQAYARGVAAIRAGAWLEAELELEQLVAQYPSYPGPHVNLAIVYLHDGRREDARAELDRALAVAPNHPAANNELAILLREQGEFEAAEQAYRRAIAADPDYALAHYNLGVLLDLYLRRPAEAVEQYELYQSLQVTPDETVGRWIIDLRRRSGADSTSRVAQEAGT
jgi:Flp pilus assembly protein TadD